MPPRGAVCGFAERGQTEMNLEIFLFPFTYLQSGRKMRKIFLKEKAIVVTHILTNDFLLFHIKP